MSKKTFTIIIVLILSIIFLSCLEDKSPITTSDNYQWVVDTTLIEDIILKVDPDRIWNNMLHITSYPDRDNFRYNIENVRDWISEYLTESGFQPTYHKYFPLDYNIYFTGKDYGFLLSNYNGPQDYITSDNGRGWHSINVPNHTDIFFVSQNKGFVTSDRENTFKTIDGGYSWELINSGLGGSSLYFTNTQNGWMVNWKKILHTHNGGIDWIETIQFNRDLFHIFVESDSLSCVTSVGRIYITNDNWQNWSEVALGDEGDYILFPIFFNYKLGFVTDEVGRIYRTKDGGLTWTEVFRLSSGYKSFEAVPPAYLWAAEDNNLFFSSDTGNTWNLVLTFKGHPYDLFFSDTLNGWISTEESLYMSSDGGRSWNNQLSSVPLGISWENIIIEIEGKISPEKEILLVGHYDTVSGNTPGADDNATGITTLLEIASIFSQYQFANTIKIVFFSGEEEGLEGSKYFVKKCRNENRNIEAVINFDALGYLAPNQPVDLNIEYNSASKSLADSLKFYIENQSIIDVTINTSYGPTSDHVSFWREDYSAVLFSEAGSRDELNPYINSYEDIIDHIDRSFLTKNIRAAVLSASWLAVPVQKISN